MRLSLVFLLVLSACGGRHQTGNTGGGQGGGSTGGGQGGGNTGGGQGGGAGVDIAAARTAAMTAPECAASAVGDFYWEVGDASGALVSGSQGTTYGADTTMAIASATKLLWGAYIIERFKTNLSMIDVPAMTFQSGYTQMEYTTCLLSLTVQACFNQGTNSMLVPANVGHFFYNGGHSQKYAMDLGLGTKTNATLATELKGVLGNELPITFDTPQLAAGANTSPNGYALFLRKILSGGLALRTHLGEQPVCTLPGAGCDAIDSPVPFAWHYSYGHWVEDAPGHDGAFSSPGFYGFYPWISRSKQHYGLVARHVTSATAYMESVNCGRAIRKAFFRE